MSVSTWNRYVLLLLLLMLLLNTDFTAVLWLVLTTLKWKQVDKSQLMMAHLHSPSPQWMHAREDITHRTVQTHKR